MRTEIAQRLETLAHMVRDGDETTIEMFEGLQAIRQLYGTARDFMADAFKATQMSEGGAQ